MVSPQKIASRKIAPRKKDCSPHSIIVPGKFFFSHENACTIPITAKNTVISPDFLVWKFCGKAQFPYSFGRFARNCAETAFPQNFHTSKSGEITVFFAVKKNDSTKMQERLDVLNYALPQKVLGWMKRSSDKIINFKSLST